MVTRSEPGSPERSQPGHMFDFCGGNLAIDFTNTVGSRGEAPEEHLNTFGDIVAWAEARGVIGRTSAGRLRREASAAPDAAARAVREAREIREALYRVFDASVEGRTARPDDLARLNRSVAETFATAALARSENGFVLATGGERGLDAIVHPVVRAAVDLLTSPALRHVGRCADAGCRWLFLDTTRSRTRRWCDMKSCGNRNKVRRFREGNG